MTKILKKIKLSFVTAIAAILGISTASNVVPLETKAMGAYRYVSLGDKMTTGFGFNDFYDESATTEDVDYKEDTGHKSVDGFKTEVTKSYPALIKEALEVEHGNVRWTQLAANSFRIDDIYYELSGSKSADEFYDLIFDATSTSEGSEKWNSIFSSRVSAEGEDANEKVHNEFVSEVSSADFITLSAGLNNFGDYVVGKLLKCLDIHTDLGPIASVLEGYTFVGSDTLQGFCDKVNLELDVNELYEYAYEIAEEVFGFDARAYATVEIGNFATLNVQEAINEVVLAFVSYCYYMNETTKLIRELNSDAEFVVIGLVNPYQGLKFKFNGKVIDAGEIYNYVLRGANLFTSLVAEAADKFKFVDPDTLEVKKLISDLDLEENEDEEIDITGYSADIQTSLFNSFYEIVSSLGVDASEITSVKADQVFSKKQSVPLTVYAARRFIYAFEAASSIDVVDIDKSLESIAFILENTDASFLTIYNAFEAKLGEGDFDSLIHLFLLFITNNGVWTMPNAAGHKAIADAVIEVSESELSARDYAINKLKEKYGPTIQEIVNKVLDNVFGFLEEVKENASEIVSEYGPIVADKLYDMTFGAARRGIAELFEDGGELVSSIISNIDSYIDGKLEKVVEYAQGKMDAGIEGLQTLVNDALAALSDHSDEIISAVKDGITFGKGLVGLLIDDINNDFARVTGFISLCGQFVRDQIAGAIESVIAFVQESIVKAYECVSEIVVMIKDTIISIIEKVSQTIVDGIEYVISVVEDIKDKINERYAFIQSKFDAINAAIDSVYEKIDNYVTERIAEVVNFVQTKVDEGLAHVSGKINAFVESVESKAQCVIDFVKSKADLATDLVNNVIEKINEKVDMIVEFVHDAGDAIHSLEKQIIEKSIVTVQDAIIGVLKAVTELYRNGGSLFVEGMQRIDEALVFAISYVANLPTEYHEEFGYVVLGYKAPESVSAEIERLLELARSETLKFVEENKDLHECSEKFEVVKDVVEHAKALLVEAEQYTGLLSVEATNIFRSIVEIVEVIFPHEYHEVIYDEDGVPCTVCEVCGWVSYDVTLDYDWEHEDDEHYWSCYVTATLPYGEVIEEEVEHVSGVTTVLPDVFGEVAGWSRYTAEFNSVPSDYIDEQDVTAGDVTYSWTDKGDACTASVELFRDTNEIDPFEVTGEVTFVVDKEKFTETGTASFEYLLGEGEETGTLGDNINIKPLTYVKDSTSYKWSEDGSTCTVKALLDVNSTAEGDNEFVEVATIENGMIKYDPETNTVVASFGHFASNTLQLDAEKEITFSEVKYEWNEEDYSSCVASQDVLLDGVVVGTFEEEAISITKEVVEPSLGVAGSYKYVAEFESFDSTETEEFEIPALTIKSTEYKWSADHSSCVAVITLSDDSVITEEGTVTSEVTKEATYSSVGKLTYTATFDLVASKVETVDIPMLNAKEGIKVSTFMKENGGTVSINGWTITFDENAAKTISKDSVLYVNCAEDYSSIEILLKDGMFDDTFEGIATVTLPFNGTVEEGHVVKVYYVYGETKVDMNGVVENGKVKFDTTHFSKFVVVDELLPEPQPEEKAPFNYWWLIIDGIILVGAFACVGCYVIVSKKEKKGTELE